MAKLKCIFCGKLTIEKEVNIQKKISGRIIAIKNALANYCPVCDETFYSNELTSVVKYVIENMSKTRPITLYEDALYEYKKNVEGIEDISTQFRKIAKQDAEPKNEVFILEDVFRGIYYENCMKAIVEEISYEVIKKDLIVFIYHYSCVKILKAIIDKSFGQDCSLKVLKEFAILSFNTNEPFVLKLSQDGITYNLGCIVKKVNKQKSILNFELVNLYEHREKRRSDRIPVSIYSEITILGEQNKYKSIIKDLSKHGLSIYSKGLFEKGSAIEIYLHTSFKVICLIGAIVRESYGKDSNEYGIEIVKINKEDMFFLKKHIMNL